MKNKQAHSLGRIKLLRDGESVFVTIKTKNGKRIANGNNEQMIKDLIKFVELNEDLLWEYWLTPSDEADSVATMQLFTKVK